MAAVEGPDLASAVMGALTGGGAAVARHEIARFLKACRTRLRSKGRAARELSEILGAFAEGADEDLGKELEQLDADTTAQAEVDIRDALTDHSSGNDSQETTAATKLVEQAQELLAKIQHVTTMNTMHVGTNSGAITQGNTGPTAIGQGATVVDTVHGHTVTLGGVHHHRK